MRESVHRTALIRCSESAYLAHLRSHAEHADCLSNYGSLLQDMGRTEEAKAALLKAIGVDDKHSAAMFNLAMLLQDEQQLAQAAKLYLRITELEPASIDALSNLATCYHQLGLVAEAVEYYHRAIAVVDPQDSAMKSTLYEHLGRSLLRLPTDHAMASQEQIIDAFSNALRHDPYNEVAQHLLSSQKQQGGEQNPPENFVRKLFDDYAADFEQSLAGLNYSAPRLIHEHLEPLMERSKVWDLVLDLGCGSGLMGQLLREKARRMVGIDLSPKMLFVAEEKGIYDLLIEGDVLAFLDELIRQRHSPPEREEVQGSRKMRGSSVAHLDQLKLAGTDLRNGLGEGATLVTAADVFVYIGDLDPLLAKLAKLVKAEDVVTFTVEALVEENEFGWLLQRSGRFAHSKSYLNRLADRYGFAVLSLERIVPRMEQGKEIEGYLTILKKNKI